jgi:hypothetical protein
LLEVTNEELLTSLPRMRDGRIRSIEISDELFKEICLRTGFIKDFSRESIRERIFCLKNNIKSVPLCPVCLNQVNFLTGGKYGETCSLSCSNRSENTKTKKTKTSLIKYGTNNPSQSQIVKEKARCTSFIRFGAPNALQNSTIKKKQQDTCLLKYGNLEYFSTYDFKNKSKQTLNIRYGVDYPLQSEEFLAKRTNSIIDKYGVPYIIFSQETKDKISISRASNFQARRNEEGTDYSGVVYILHFPQHQAVKIGLTSDFNFRSKGLIKDFGEFSVIDIIETEECFKLESSLHQKFANYRICLEEGCGRTEFFNEEILKEINE